MHTPTSKQAYFVAQVFREAIERYPGLRLDMDEPDVNIANHCGTVHCHGGTYAAMRCDLGLRLGYKDGANQMAVDLGFLNFLELKEWANLNPTIWGNVYGYEMFAWPLAFISPSRPRGALSIQQIADHWNEVAQRLEAIEKENEPKLKPKNMEYTVDYFIEKFEAIPEEKWCTGSDGWNGLNGKFCADGHCGSTGKYRTDESTALVGLLKLLPLSRAIKMEIEVIYCYNDGLVKSYQQPTPKQRILAALYDIRRIQDKPAETAPCADITLPAFIPVSYTKMELVGAN